MFIRQITSCFLALYTKPTMSSSGDENVFVIRSEDISNEITLPFDKESMLFIWEMYSMSPFVFLVSIRFVPFQYFAILN